MPPLHHDSELAQLLADLAARINGNAGLRGTLAGWSPDVYIEAQDTGLRFRLRFADGKAGEVLPTEQEPPADAILLRGDKVLLCDVFCGALNPLAAHAAGELEVRGSRQDKVKLDAIALVLWGA